MPTPELLGTTFEAIVFDWDGTAVTDRQADAGPVRTRVEALVRAGVHVVVVSGTHVGNIDGQLGARPAGPGTLHLCLNRGSEVFRVGPDGPELVWRRAATPAEDAALDHAAELTVSRLGAIGITAKVVSQRVNRRKVDVIPEPEWDDPPKARIAELLAAVTERLETHGLTDALAGAVALAVDAARDAGVEHPKVTSDAKHVEIGLTDKADSMRWVLTFLSDLGIGPGLVLVAGDEFGDLGNVTGSDAMMLVPEVDRALAVSVGVEPQGTPPGVRHLGGGPAAFVDLLDEQIERRRVGRVPAIDDDPRWVVRLEDSEARRRVNESVCALSNGHIGVRGSREEDGHGANALVIASGVYTGGKAPRLLAGPVWPVLMIRPTPDAPDTWALDLRTGVLTRTCGRPDAPIRTFRFVSMPEPAVMAMRAEGPTSRLAAGEAFLAPGPDIGFEHHRGGALSVATTRSDQGGGLAIATVTRDTVADGRRHVERLAVHDAEPSRAPDSFALARDLERRTGVGFDRLLADHRAAWAGRWRHAAVTIDGDPDAEIGARLSIFHLLGAVRRGEAAVGARGLTGPAYAGHVFWDSDVFVLPAVAALDPAAARAMLEYRVRRLGAARDLAARRGAKGARFPWESAHDGYDVTPPFARGRDGTIIPIRTGEREDHINADIAWAAREYAAWSGDDEFLRGDGRSLVVETARFWASRLRVDRDGRAHIFGVIGPDEYHEVVDDDAYTNVMARWHLRLAAKLAAEAGGAGADEQATWVRLADALVDGFVPEERRYEQFAGYDRLAPDTVARHATPPIALDLLIGLEAVKRSQLIKQADVVMLHHLVPEELAPGSLAADLDFYGPRTAHGSSLSPPIHAAVLARAGRPDEALDLFRIACRLDLDDLTDTTSGGVHLATMGGVWQALTYGFLGLRPRRTHLAVDPRLPSAWTGVEVNLRYRGSAVRVRATHDSLDVTSDPPIDIRREP